MQMKRKNNCPSFCHCVRLIPAILTPIQFLVLLHALSYVLADILKAFCFWDTSLAVYPQDALCTVNTDQKPQNSFWNCMQRLPKCKHVALPSILGDKLSLHSKRVESPRRGDWIYYNCAINMKKLYYPTKRKALIELGHSSSPEQQVCCTSYTSISTQVTAFLLTYTVLMRFKTIQNILLRIKAEFLDWDIFVISQYYFSERLGLDNSF